MGDGEGETGEGGGGGGSQGGILGHRGSSKGMGVGIGGVGAVIISL